MKSLDKISHWHYIYNLGKISLIWVKIRTMEKKVMRKFRVNPSMEKKFRVNPSKEKKAFRVNPSKLN